MAAKKTSDLIDERILDGLSWKNADWLDQEVKTERIQTIGQLLQYLARLYSDTFTSACDSAGEVEKLRAEKAALRQQLSTIRAIAANADEILYVLSPESAMATVG